MYSHQRGSQPAHTSRRRCVRILLPYRLMSHQDLYPHVFTYLSTFFPHLTFGSSLAPTPHLLIQTLSHQNHAHPALTRSRFLRQKCTSQGPGGFLQPSSVSGRTMDQPLCMQAGQGDASTAHQELCEVVIIPWLISALALYERW